MVALVINECVFFPTLIRTNTSGFFLFSFVSHIGIIHVRCVHFRGSCTHKWEMMMLNVIVSV